jgi:hypothetical protein
VQRFPWPLKWLTVSFVVAVVACSATSPTNAEGSAMIGAAGGSLLLSDGTRIDVPRGALDRDVTITAAIDDAASASREGRFVTGPIYHFAPDGLVFAKPVTLTMVVEPSRLPQGRTIENATVITSASSSGVYELLSTSPQDVRHVTATTLHFSWFTVAVEVGASTADGGESLSDASDAASSDAGPDEASSSDGGAGDAAAEASAGSAALCPGATDLTPDGGLVLPSRMVLPVQGNAACTSPPSLYGFALTEPTQVTMWNEERAMADADSALAFDVGCSPGAPACVNGAGATGLLGPGWHHFGLNGATVNPVIVFERPPPPATNTTCSTALALVDGQPLDVPRIVDNTPRIFSFVHGSSSSSTFYTIVNVRPAGAPDVECGLFTWSQQLFSACGDPSSEVPASPSGGNCKFNAGPLFMGYSDQDSGGVNKITQPGTYYLVITAQPGVKLTIDYHVTSVN